MQDDTPFRLNHIGAADGVSLVSRTHNRSQIPPAIPLSLSLKTAIAGI